MSVCLMDFIQLALEDQEKKKKIEMIVLGIVQICITRLNEDLKKEKKRKKVFKIEPLS